MNVGVSKSATQFLRTTKFDPLVNSKQGLGYERYLLVAIDRENLPTDLVVTTGHTQTRAIGLNVATVFSGFLFQLYEY